MKNAILLKIAFSMLKIYDWLKQEILRVWVGRKSYIIYKHYKRLRKIPNLKTPSTFNEKLLWLKLHWRNDQAKLCADKYTVREFVEKRIGSKYLNKLIANYNSVEEIDISKLPNQFVLKASHGSGFNVICKSKSSLIWDLEKERLKRWMNRNYYLYNGEWVYDGLRPTILCETYISEINGEDLLDYKFFCFHGEPKIIQVDFDRFTDHKRNWYSTNWEFLDLSVKYPNDPSRVIPKPNMLNEMLVLARELSKDFPHVRVDFYELEKKIIFGEMTFFHGSGNEKFSSIKYEELLGSWLNLEAIPNEQLI